MEEMKRLFDMTAEGSETLLLAVRNGDERMVDGLITRGEADINVTDKNGWTALFYAINKENEKIIQKLIECGVDINAKDKVGRTALSYAVEKGKETTVQKLIECDADINSTEKHGKTPLFYAVWETNEKMVEKVMEYGADINAADNDGRTALFYAVGKGNEKMVHKLIEYGADINTKDTFGSRTVLFYAAEEGNENMVQKLIVCRADTNTTDKHGKTALFIAVQVFNNEHVVDALINAGADVNITDHGGKTALFFAVQIWNNKYVVDALINAGADVNISDHEGKTALFFATRLMAHILIENGGARVDARDRYGRTPLFYAMTESLPLAEYLLIKGASLHLNGNCSVLTYFFEKCYLNSSENTLNLQGGLSLLTEHKELQRSTILEAVVSVAFFKAFCFQPGCFDIDVGSLDELMRLAKEYCSAFKFFSKVNFPFGKSKTISTISNIIHKACPDKKLIESGVPLELTRLLIQLGANPNTTDSDGNTALHHATQLAFHGVTQESVMEICQQLEKLNVSFSIKNHQDETPLLYCLSTTIEMVSIENEPWPAVKTQAAVFRFLVEHGSDVEAKTRSGETVLHLTLKLFQKILFGGSTHLKEYINVVLGDFLQIISNGYVRNEVSICTKDDDGNTPLHLWAKVTLATEQDYSRNITRVLNFKDCLKIILNHLIRQDEALLHIKNEDGETPLHLCRTWAAVELLLDAGANPNDLDSSGRTPLLVAARNSESAVQSRGLLYPDILLAPARFCRRVVNKGFNPWTVDKHGESVFTVLMESESHDLAKSLVDVAFDHNRPINSLVLFSLLTAICKDKLRNAHWKKDAAKKILNTTKCPVNGNDNEDSPLHYICRNIVEVSKALPEEEVKDTVFWGLAKLLRSFGADYSIPDARDQSCLDMAEECPVIKELLMDPLNWESVDA